MKAFKQILIISAVIGLSGCSAEDVPETVNTDASSDWNECPMTIDSPAPGFDGISTRAESGAWPDMARVYINFTKADGSTTYGSAVYNSETESWTLSYNGRLDSQTPRECKVYYFEGGNVSDNAIHTIVTPSSGTAVYGATGSYNYKDGNVNLSASLSPLTSRIRFKRTSTSGSFTGLMRNFRTLFRFDLITCDFTMTSPLSGIAVTFRKGEEYSDYIYALQDFSGYEELDELKNEIRVNYGGYVYSYELPSNSGFMKIGESGYMNWPTPDYHNGWYSYEYSSATKLFSIGANSSNYNLSYSYEAAVNKFDVIKVTFRPSLFYGNQYYSDAACFILNVDGDRLLDLKYGSLYPGESDGTNNNVYYVVPSGKLLPISWEASYWYSSSSSNYVERIIF